MCFVLRCYILLRKLETKFAKLFQEQQLWNPVTKALCLHREQTYPSRTSDATLKFCIRVTIIFKVFKK